MWHAADLQDRFSHHGPGYKFKGIDKPQFDWASFKPQRDAYVKRLNGIYASNFDKEGVEFHHGTARLVSPNSVEVKRGDGSTYTLNGDRVTICVGGRPNSPSESQIPGASKGIDSDGFFGLTEQPKRVAVVGAGYIAVELAGVLNALGSETHLIIRGESVLRTFDPTIQEVLTPWMEKTGIKIHKSSQVTRVDGERGQTLTVNTNKGEKIDVDTVLWAIGRSANTKGLGLGEVGIKVDKKGDIVVDEYQNTNVKNVYAIGDVAGKWLLTPVAIAAGRRLSNRLFGGPEFKDEKLSYENVPTVVFAYVKDSCFFRRTLSYLVLYLSCRHPPIGTVGMTEPQARQKYGDAVKICTLPMPYFH
jgi:glutathione reductase (NADPH)